MNEQQTEDNKNDLTGDNNNIKDLNIIKDTLNKKLTDLTKEIVQKQNRILEEIESKKNQRKNISQKIFKLKNLLSEKNGKLLKLRLNVEEYKENTNESIKIHLRNEYCEIVSELNETFEKFSEKDSKNIIFSKIKRLKEIKKNGEKFPNLNSKIKIFEEALFNLISKTIISDLKSPENKEKPFKMFELFIDLIKLEDLWNNKSIFSKEIFSETNELFDYNFNTENKLNNLERPDWIFKFLRKESKRILSMLGFYIETRKNFKKDEILSGKCENKKNIKKEYVEMEKKYLREFIENIGRMITIKVCEIKNVKNSEAQLRILLGFSEEFIKFKKFLYEITKIEIKNKILEDFIVKKIAEAITDKYISVHSDLDEEIINTERNKACVKILDDFFEIVNKLIGVSNAVIYIRIRNILIKNLIIYSESFLNSLNWLNSESREKILAENVDYFSRVSEYFRLKDLYFSYKLKKNNEKINYNLKQNDLLDFIKELIMKLLNSLKFSIKPDLRNLFVILTTKTSNDAKNEIEIIFLRILLQIEEITNIIGKTSYSEVLKDEIMKDIDKFFIENFLLSKKLEDFEVLNFEIVLEKLFSEYSSDSRRILGIIKDINNIFTADDSVDAKSLNENMEFQIEKILIKNNVDLKNNYEFKNIIFKLYT